MSEIKIISIKLSFSGPNVGPFDIIDSSGNILLTGLTKQRLIEGVTATVNSNDTFITIKSNGDCVFQKTVTLNNISSEKWQSSQYSEDTTGCLWTHLKNTKLYNYYYGKIQPYIIEYPFSYKGIQDEILQNVKDYSKVYTYLPEISGSFDTNRKVQTNDKWFNKAILYNGQQCSGILDLVPKPLNNLSAYIQYPIFNTDSKTITFTKSDSFYQYNTFWALQVDDQIPMFNTSCKSLSIDKEINQTNMDYGQRSFKKSPLRAKNLKVRHILDNSSTTHIVSQFIIAPSQISYK